jgi:hypothetical protein
VEETRTDDGSFRIDYHADPRLQRLLGDTVAVFNGYGSTETTSAVVTCVGEEYAAPTEKTDKRQLREQLLTPNEEAS